MNIEKPIFLDNQSTTALDSRVFEKMSPFFKEDYGNLTNSPLLWKRSK